MSKRIVETDNYGGDYPAESFLKLPPLSEAQAHRIADAINEAVPNDYPRYWKVVDETYELQPGFEP